MRAERSSQIPVGLRAPVLVVGVTSLPSRLCGAAPALLSIAAQDRRPDRLVLSLPYRSQREGRDYQLPQELCSLLKAHPWIEVNWVDEDYGPGTKLLGVLQWLETNLDGGRDDDVLMVLDDDHSYHPFALGELLREQQSRGASCVCSFFAYFCRGLMIPQGADIIAFRLGGDFSANLVEYHRKFVSGDSACFIVDDLWVAMFLRLSGFEVVSLRDKIVQRGLEMVYTRTSNANVEALMDLSGESRRDRATIRAFDNLLMRLLEAGTKNDLERWGGAAAQRRLQQLEVEVRNADRQIASLDAWLTQGNDVGSHSEKARAQLKQLRHLYQMQAGSA